jgi:hypothetical protein
MATPLEQDTNRMMNMPKWELQRFARKVKAALPAGGVITTGRKADIALSIFVATQ